MYKEQLKRESVLTAKAIINNDTVKIRYEKYIKVTDVHELINFCNVLHKVVIVDLCRFQGEDPFVVDAKEDTSSDLSEPEDDD